MDHPSAVRADGVVVWFCLVLELCLVASNEVQFLDRTIGHEALKVTVDGRAVEMGQGSMQFGSGHSAVGFLEVR